MKTLVNKSNPQIRITADVEILYDKSRCVKYYYIKDLRLGLLEENWTLVEGIKGNPEGIPSNVDLEKEIDACWRNWLSPSNRNEVEEVLPKAEFAMHARHFYEFGRKGGRK